MAVKETCDTCGERETSMVCDICGNPVCKYCRGKCSVCGEIFCENCGSIDNKICENCAENIDED